MDMPPDPVEADAELLRRFLTGRDVECPRCDYNLRDLRGDRCPECGDQIVLRLNVAEPGQAAGIAGLVGLSTGMGFNGMLAIFCIARQHFPDGFSFYVGGGFAIEGAALAIWIKYWRGLRKLPPARQWRWALLAWLLTLADLAIFTANNR